MELWEPRMLFNSNRFSKGDTGAGVKSLWTLCGESHEWKNLPPLFSGRTLRPVMMGEFYLEPFSSLLQGAFLELK